MKSNSNFIFNFKIQFEIAFQFHFPILNFILIPQFEIESQFQILIPKMNRNFILFDRDLCTQKINLTKSHIYGTILLKSRRGSALKCATTTSPRLMAASPSSRTTWDAWPLSRLSRAAWKRWHTPSSATTKAVTKARERLYFFDYRDFPLHEFHFCPTADCFNKI